MEPMTAQDEGDRRSRAEVRRFSSARDADRADLEFWMRTPAADRILEVWRLSQEQWELSATSPDEPRLSRSVTCVRRR